MKARRQNAKVLGGIHPFDVLLNDLQQMHVHTCRDLHVLGRKFGRRRQRAPVHGRNG